MGILNRFKDIMASNVNALFNKEDKHPEKAIEKYLVQMRGDIGQIKSETAAHEADVRRAKMAYDENQNECAKFERYIAKVRESGSVSDESFYTNKLETVRQEGEKLRQKYELAKQNLDNLSAMNDKLTTDVATLEGKLEEIKSKIREAEAKEKMSKIAAKSRVDTQDQLFSKMSDKADYMLDRANAMEALERSNPISDYDDIANLASKYEGGGVSPSGEDITYFGSDSSSDNDGPIEIK